VPTDPLDEETRCTVKSTPHCTLLESAGLECTVHYDNLQVDAAGAERFLRSRGFSEDLVGQYLQVGSSLQHQAQGIVRIPADRIRRDDVRQ
jgi:hypothetical protein